MAAPVTGPNGVRDRLFRPNGNFVNFVLSRIVFPVVAQTHFDVSIGLRGTDPVNSFAPYRRKINQICLNNECAAA